MKERLLDVFRGRNEQILAALTLLTVANSAHAISGGLKQGLTTLICSVAGSSSITMFAGAAAVISFLVMFTLGEGKEGTATILKICIGISGLMFLPDLVNLIAPQTLPDCRSFQKI